MESFWEHLILHQIMHHKLILKGTVGFIGQHSTSQVKKMSETYLSGKAPQKYCFYLQSCWLALEMLPIIPSLELVMSTSNRLSLYNRTWNESLHTLALFARQRFRWQVRRFLWIPLKRFLRLHQCQQHWPFFRVQCHKVALLLFRYAQNAMLQKPGVTNIFQPGNLAFSTESSEARAVSQMPLKSTE